MNFEKLVDNIRNSICELDIKGKDHEISIQDEHRLDDNEVIVAICIHCNHLCLAKNHPDIIGSYFIQDYTFKGEDLR